MTTNRYILIVYLRWPSKTTTAILYSSLTNDFNLLKCRQKERAVAFFSSVSISLILEKNNTEAIKFVLLFIQLLLAAVSNRQVVAWQVEFRALILTCIHCFDIYVHSLSQCSLHNYHRNYGNHNSMLATVSWIRHRIWINSVDVNKYTQNCSQNKTLTAFSLRKEKW